MCVQIDHLKNILDYLKKHSVQVYFIQVINPINEFEEKS